jgi:uncharacterized protein (TIGR03067 family)
MRTCALLLAAAAALAFAPAPFPRPARRVSDPNQEVLKKLQGTWITVTRIAGGGVMRNHTAVIAGDRVKYLLNGEVRTEWAITLDATKKPGVFDQRKVGGRVGLGEVMPGIYRLEGDTLTICYRQNGTERPANFDGSQRDNWLDVMKRQKP